jgi:hypothetical protein
LDCAISVCGTEVNLFSKKYRTVWLQQVCTLSKKR